MARRKPGRTKAPPYRGGRHKGKPNKQTLKNCLELINALDCFGLNPLELVYGNVNKLKPFERVKVGLELMSYIYPKRKPVDKDGDASDTGNYEVTVIWDDDADTAQDPDEGKADSSTEIN